MSQRCPKLGSRGHLAAYLESRMVAALDRTSREFLRRDVRQDPDGVIDELFKQNRFEPLTFDLDGLSRSAVEVTNFPDGLEGEYSPIPGQAVIIRATYTGSPEL